MTYTLDSETGMSLRYARWKRDPHVSRGGTWDRPSRPREDKAPTEPKVRWYRDLHPLEPNPPAPKDARQGDFWQRLVGDTERQPRRLRQSGLTK